MKKGESIFKKIKSLSKGIDPAIEGFENYKKNDPQIEAVAKRRAQACLKCPLMIDEPISFLKVEDARIPFLSGKINSECGCALPYLVRQNQKICKCWNENEDL